jgi:hypothetical protein
VADEARMSLECGDTKDEPPPRLNASADENKTYRGNRA